jgi:hypothetical protein
MAYEIKGRVITNRPIRNTTAKRLPVERVVYQRPLCPRLRPKDGLTHAIGFTAQITSDDEIA